MHKTPNFNLIFSKEIADVANHKFFILAPNGLEAIAANLSNHVGK